MKKIEYYQAIDDEIFPYKEACEKYEYKITHFPEVFTFWAEDGVTVLEGDGTVEGIRIAYKKAEYLDVGSFCGEIFGDWAEAVAFMEWYFGFDLSGIMGPGRYRYNDNYADWERIDEDM